MHLIAMDAIRIETLPTSKSLLSSKIQEATDISKEKDDILFLDEVDEDDEIHLRLSDDDEVEVEQDNTSGQTNENQQTNTETKGTDLQEVTKSNNKQLADKSDLSDVESVQTVEKDNCDSNIVDENIDETDSVNEEDSTMSGSDRLPHLMQDSPKYWSNNLDKRWKGQNQSRNRQNHHHRNSNNWYHQQFPEKDRYNNKNHFNHHRNNFKKSKNSTRGSYDNSSREINKEEAKKEEINDSSKLKSNLSSSIESDKNHLIKENGFSSDLKSKENSSSAKKDQLSEKTKESETDSDQKENKFNSCESKNSSDQKCKENGSSNTDTIIKELEVNDSNHSESAVKDCNEETVEKVKEKENESTNKDETDKTEEDQVEHEEKNENLVQVDKVLDVSNAPKRTSDNDETSGNAKDNDVEVNKNIDDSEDAESKNEVESEKSNNSELTEKDASESASTATLKESEAMEVEVNDESSNCLSTTSSEDKGIDKSIESDDSKPSNMDDKNSSSTMIVEEIHYEEMENDKEVKESEQSESSKSNIIAQEKVVEAAEKPKVNNIIEEVDLVDDEDMEEASKLNETEKNISKTQIDAAKTSTVTGTSQAVPLNNLEEAKVEEGSEEGRAVVHKRRRRKRTAHQIFSAEFQDGVLDLPVENGVRQKRRSAKNAEEMIRKEILKDDEENGDSSDESEKTVPVNYKKNNVHARPLSPPSLPSLKRTLEELDCISDSVTLKRIKSSNDTSITMTSKEKKEFVPFSKEVIAETNELVRKISQEDIRKKIKKFKPEELEAMLVQKILECITIRGEMGKLREQARVSKRNQEAARAKCQQLQKQVEGFDMVLKRITYDKNSNAEKYVTPIKINRSVGLQVNFPTAAKLTGSGASISPTSSKTSTTPSNAMQDNRSLAQSPRKVLKTRSPRRIDATTPTTINTVSSTSSPTTLVMGKSVDPNNKRTITLQNSNNIVQILPAGQSQSAVVVNSTVGGAPSSRPTTLTIQRANNVNTKASDLIDLTDEEDKLKTTVITPITTTSLSARFPRVLQAVPASVALSNTTNLRLVQAGGQGSPTAIVNNINNSPRVTYVMQSGVNGSSTRQILLTSNSTIRPVTTVSSKNIPTITYKQGVTTLPNGAVRVLTTTAPTTNLQSAKHPAPLPESPLPESNPVWKLAPPAPSLKISKVATGIVLSWNMTLSDKYAEIVSYQLYAYQEVTGTTPSAALWKKVGDVRALPLPMACTLTQFTEGNNYYFAVRAVDVHSRFGKYSAPGNISL